MPLKRYTLFKESAKTKGTWERESANYFKNNLDRLKGHRTRIFI